MLNGKCPQTHHKKLEMHTYMPVECTQTMHITVETHTAHMTVEMHTSPPHNCGTHILHMPMKIHTKPPHNWNKHCPHTCGIAHKAST